MTSVLCAHGHGCVTVGWGTRVNWSTGSSDHDILTPCIIMYCLQRVCWFWTGCEPACGHVQEVGIMWSCAGSGYHVVMCRKWVSCDHVQEVSNINFYVQV